jgi:anaerobic selenocysteine-containing dehydrogenase
MVGVRGRATDRINHGRLGPTGLYGSWQWSDQDRLTRPLVREGGQLVETDWATVRPFFRSRSEISAAISAISSDNSAGSGTDLLCTVLCAKERGSAGHGSPRAIAVVGTGYRADMKDSRIARDFRVPASAARCSR